MKRTGLAVVLAMVAAGWAAQAALKISRDDQQIRELLARNAEAWTKNDPVAFSDILAEDVVFTENGGLNDGRASVLEHVRQDHAGVRSMTLTTEVQRVRVAGRMAWAYAIERAWIVPREGEPFTLKSHSIFALEKNGKRWWIAAHGLSARRERPGAQRN